MRDFSVILTTFLASALLAWFLALPALRWAEGGQDWQGFIAMAWLLACMGGSAYGAFRVMAWYHRTTSLGRRKNS